jgi:hypothetical protein
MNCHCLLAICELNCCQSAGYTAACHHQHSQSWFQVPSSVWRKVPARVTPGKGEMGSTSQKKRSHFKTELLHSQLNSCWFCQHSHSWFQSPNDPWPRSLYPPRHVLVSKLVPLFDKEGVNLSMQALCLLHWSFTTSIYAMSWRPGHYGLCASSVTPLY